MRFFQELDFSIDSSLVESLSSNRLIQTTNEVKLDCRFFLSTNLIQSRHWFSMTSHNTPFIYRNISLSNQYYNIIQQFYLLYYNKKKQKCSKIVKQSTVKHFSMLWLQRILSNLLSKLF